MSRPALVLGSTQRRSIVDDAACASRGVEVAARPSGGGVVFVDPVETLWVDVVLPVGDPLWVVDVGRSAAWLGDAWARALGASGAVADPVVHEGSMCLSRWGRLVCFAGLGPGEVTAGPGGPKVVGISQRRTRAGARFQCAVPFAWDARSLAGLLTFESVDERDAAVADLSAPGVVHPVTAATPQALLDAFLAELPAY
ncbi:MAG TPA: hypothetical protein VF230_12175 [Acidimicrobiales bacterium]